MYKGLGRKKAESKVGMGRKRLKIGSGRIKVRRVVRKGIGASRGKIKPSKPTDTHKLWSLKKADREFRTFMLKIVPIQCVFPNCPITDPKKLTVSHYHGRVNKGTRYDVRNCDFICRNHHYWDKQLGWEFAKQTVEKHGWNGRYTLFMMEKLAGQWFIVKSLAESGMKQKAAIQQFRALLP